MAQDDSTTAVSLCARLRNERERRQILLSSISANTKISAGLFEALERGDVSRWPSGIFRRSFIRAYAGAIGLDPDAIAREFLEQFPDPLDPPAVPATPAAAPVVAASGPASTAGLRLKLADTPTPFVQGRLLTCMRQRWAAVACDGGIILALALCVFIACDSFWLPLGVTMIAYYLGGILLLGNTPGVCLQAPNPPGQAHYNPPADEAAHADEDQRTHSDWRLRVPAR
jgi:hypothetical protein